MGLMYKFIIGIDVRQ